MKYGIDRETFEFASRQRTIDAYDQLKQDHSNLDHEVWAYCECATAAQIRTMFKEKDIVRLRLLQAKTLLGERR